MNRLRKHIGVALGATAGSLLVIQGCGKSAPSEADDCDFYGLCGDASADLDTGVIPPGADGASDAPSWQCCDSSVPGSDAPTGPTPDASSDATDTTDAADSADATPECEDASYCGAGKGCVDTTTSVTNCGACGKACTAPTGGTVTCANSACAPACPSGFENCQNQCISVDNLSNCGGCGNVCPGPANGSNGSGTATCVDAGCELTCASGAHVCGKDCLLNTDPPSTDPCIVSSTYGIFVSPTGSDTSGNGTQASPYATIGKGAAAAKSAGLLDVFACGTFTSNVTINVTMDGRKIYGGFNCSSWAFSASTNTVVAPASPGIALTVSGLTAGVTFTNFEFDAMAASSPGASSIGVFVASSPVAFVSSKITAGNGAPGASGGTFSNYSGTTPGGSNVTSTAGAAGGQNACLDLTTSSTGGTGATENGVFAQNGSSVPAVGAANGGSSAATSCSAGTIGANGSSVTNGGSGSTSAGSLSASGWVTAKGSDGADGDPGQGGGGGGAESVGIEGGGGGGAGGCGGGRGLGGQTGGSSIALLSFNSAITLTTCNVASGNGETGGNGGSGQVGQTGGGIGVGACNGGVGGVGSGGGGGGGGAGGLSASVYWTGTAPVINGASVSSAATLTGFTFGTAGTPGLLGSGAAAVGGGAGGQNGTPGASPPVPAAVIEAP